METKPGDWYQYNNLAYGALAATVETVSGQRFEDFCIEHLFRPAGMADATFISSSVDADRIPKDRRGDGRAWGYGTDLGWDYRGSGAAVTTTTELLAWDRALRGEAVLSAAAKAELYKPALENYAMGWQVRSSRGDVRYTHSGATGGMASYLLRTRDSEIVIAIGYSYRPSRSPEQTVEALLRMVERGASEPAEPSTKPHATSPPPPPIEVDHSTEIAALPADIRSLRVRRIEADGFDALARLKSLEHLEVSGFCTEDEPLLDYYLPDNAIETITGLRKLRSLRFYVIEDLEPLHLAHLDRLPFLEELRLDYLELEDAHVVMCRRLPMLRRLTLKGSGEISDAGVKLIASMEQLVDLRLIGLFEISRHGYRQLGALKKLRVLDLSAPTSSWPRVGNVIPYDDEGPDELDHVDDALMGRHRLPTRAAHARARAPQRHPRRRPRRTRQAPAPREARPAGVQTTHAQGYRCAAAEPACPQPHPVP